MIMKRYEQKHFGPKSMLEERMQSADALKAKQRSKYPREKQVPEKTPFSTRTRVIFLRYRETLIIP